LGDGVVAADPTGPPPPCSRSAAHSRATFVDHFATPAQIAGSASRPVFSVLSAIFSPCPSRPMTFPAGTKTSSKRVTEFSIPRRPMNALRCSTVTPGLSYGTMNAVMPPRRPSDGGTCAITTTRSATAPFVAHSLRPDRR
jgi:hypothetical protein